MTDHRVHCSRCGKGVSNPLDTEPIVRAWIECPECIAAARRPPDGPGDPTWLRPKPEPFACYDCGLPYGGPGWCDSFIPTDVWVKISPTGDDGGVLCITCMARRIEYLGLDKVPLIVGSGPWLHDPEVTRLDGLRQGRKQVLDEFRREAQHADRVGNVEETTLLLDIAHHVEKVLG